MVWFKVDDKFHASEKRHLCTAAALGVWVVAGSWCGAREKGDGNVPSNMLASFGGTKRHAAELVRAGLWHAAGHDCDRCPQPTDPAGWIFHDWTDQNPSEVEIKAKREAEREKKRRWRERLAARRASTGDDTEDEPGIPEGVTRESLLTRPDPTRPEEELTLRGNRDVPARAATATAHPPNEPPRPLSPADARCTAHVGVADPGPCRGCQAAREREQRLADRAAEKAQREREEAVRNCPDCEGTHFVLDANKQPTGRKCTHSRTRARAS